MCRAFRHTMAMMLSATVAVAGCATTSTARAAPAYVGSQAIADPNALVDYLHDSRDRRSESVRKGLDELARGELEPA